MDKLQEIYLLERGSISLLILLPFVSRADLTFPETVFLDPVDPARHTGYSRTTSKNPRKV